MSRGGTQMTNKISGVFVSFDFGILCFFFVFLLRFFFGFFSQRFWIFVGENFDNEKILALIFPDNQKFYRIFFVIFSSFWSTKCLCKMKNFPSRSEVFLSPLQCKVFFFTCNLHFFLSFSLRLLVFLCCVFDGPCFPP